MRAYLHDGDGTLETILYPVTDLPGSVEVLTNEEGRIVERIAYDPDGSGERLRSSPQVNRFRVEAGHQRWPG